MRKVGAFMHGIGGDCMSIKEELSVYVSEFECVFVCLQFFYSLASVWSRVTSKPGI